MFYNVTLAQSGTIWHNLRVPFAVPFDEAKNDGFVISTTTTFASNPTSPEEGLVNFDLATQG